jgi:hypothetical protein
MRSISAYSASPLRAGQRDVGACCRRGSILAALGRSGSVRSHTVSKQWRQTRSRGTGRCADVNGRNGLIQETGHGMPDGGLWAARIEGSHG